ncbi:MAG: GGDEF domain-containing protein [Novosphingobium sp.]
MDRRRSGNPLRAWRAAALPKPGPPLTAALYRDLVTPLFTMRVPIIGFGFLYFCVSVLVLMRWPDPAVFAMMVSAVVVTTARVVVLDRYRAAGGPAQSVPVLKVWERRYAILTYGFAALLAALNIRVLTVHEPLLHTAAIALVFTFGAGVVSRTSYRPRLCIAGLLIAVVPTALALFVHAASAHGEALHAGFFVFLGVLMTAVLGMSLESVRHLYAAALEQLVTKHDLAQLARYDPLTELPNRLMLREAFSHRLETAQRTGAALALHYLDLDGFKAINDGYGHPVGDRMLCEVAKRLLATIRADDTVFRLGGDEFLIIQAGVGHRDEAQLLARRIIKQLSDAYAFDGAEMRISVSVGIALTSDAGTDIDALIACADAALYRSKTRGKAQLQFCEPGFGEPGRSAA